jgi:hypothetical protein
LDAQPSKERRGTSFRSDKQTLGRIIESSDSPQILLVISHSTPSSRYENHYLLFAITDMNADTSLPDTLYYTTLLAEPTTRMREPLAFLSRARLHVLNVHC